MSQTKQAPALLCDDAISVKIAGERRHFICIGIYSDKIKGYTYDLFDDEEPLECGLENPEVCESCQ